MAHLLGPIMHAQLDADEEEDDGDDGDVEEDDGDDGHVEGGDEDDNDHQSG